MSFSVESITAIGGLKPGSRIHVIGVCGVAMAQVAVRLSKMGFKVSGSDKEYFEPMSSLLMASTVTCLHSYQVEHITDDIDLVVIGNSVTANNPEVLASNEKGLAYTIFPKVLNELIISNRNSIVVLGTHGKTTTAGMLAFVLEKLKLKPSYFIGGRASQLSASLKIAEGSISVVEGDEYDSAFFAKLPKFHFYKPDILIISSIEFDHADIYPNLEAIKTEFVKLAESMPKGSTLIACADDQGVRGFILKVADAKYNLITYGESVDSDVAIKFGQGNSGSLTATFKTPSGQTCELSLEIPGRYNLKNAVAAVLALESAGVTVNQEMRSAFFAFKGVDRRQQIWLKKPIILIEDFAHHPTAVRETLRGIKEWLPGRKLIAVFEPRSNTSRKKIFQSDYVSAFKDADVLVMKDVEARSTDSADDLFDVQVVCRQISEGGVKATSFKEIKEIQDWILRNAAEGDVVVIMSNGAFGGLIQSLAKSFAQT